MAKETVDPPHHSIFLYTLEREEKEGAQGWPVFSQHFNLQFSWNGLVT